MSLLAYASVPIYSLFCKVTGFGGTPKIGYLSSSKIGNRELLIKFDANVDSKLPWQFKPEQNEIKLITGQNVLVFYRAKNLSKEPIVGTAVYNITPEKVAKYFNKIQCFCFEEQLLKAGEEVSMPVTFFIDSELDNDPSVKDVKMITLSYSFYRAR
jgi:cytochrome c oxidase assembly protein subunit 11